MSSGSVDAIERGRRACAEGAWAVADGALNDADAQAPLGAEDLELLATAAYMLGRLEDYLSRLGRAHDAYFARGEPLRAAGCALWIGVTLALRGKAGRANGWIARAERLVALHGAGSVEAAFVRVPEMFARAASGDRAGAIDIAREIVAAAQRCGADDLFALATHSQGHFLVMEGRVEECLRLLDEAMLVVTAGKTSPIPTGIVYCGVITGCQAAFDVRRASEWTAELAQWCERHPEMVAFSGRCLVHRAELIQRRGAWSDAMEEVKRAAVRCAQADNPQAAAEAAYRRGELHRLRGELSEAEAAYRRAGRGGRDPQPGLALLWLARGDTAAAAVALRRMLAETTDRPGRATLLPAVVEAMIAAGDMSAARDAAFELEEIAAAHRSELLAATAAQTAGAVALAEGDAEAALRALRRAGAAWRELEAPYDVACVRVLVARACRLLDDEESAIFELEAARETFERLGATPNVAAVDDFLGRAARDAAHGLTKRELEVLRLVAAGETNKAIAAELVLSDRTVDRHVSNILAKLRVGSRAAATAYAYAHRLL